MGKLNTSISRILLLLLLAQQVAVANNYAGADQHGATEPAATSAHCKTMESEPAAVHDNGDEGHRECAEAGCNDCVACAVCLPQFVGSESHVAASHARLLKINFSAVPEPGFLLRPPINS